MKAKLIKKIKKRFIIKYTDCKYNGVVLHDTKKKEVINCRNIREAMDWVTFRFGMFYEYQSWRSKKDYKINVRKFYNAI